MNNEEKSPFEILILIQARANRACEAFINDDEVKEEEELKAIIALANLGVAQIDPNKPNELEHL